MADKQTHLQKFHRIFELDGSTGILGAAADEFNGYRVYGETTLRVTPIGVGGTNVIDIEARLEGQDSFTSIGSVTGTTSATLGIDTYDYIRFNVTTADGTGEVIASGFFNQVGTFDGESISSFKTIQTDAGTSPVADSPSDTLTLTSSDGSVTITGNSGTDTIDLVTVADPNSGTWGFITGNLSNQTDLQTALDGKFDVPTGTTDDYIRGDGTVAVLPDVFQGEIEGGFPDSIYLAGDVVDGGDYND